MVIEIIGVIATGIGGWYTYRSYRITRNTNQQPTSTALPEPVQLTIQSNIPSPDGTFLGRGGDMDRVAGKLGGRWPIVMIEGLGGVGKTALATSVARQQLTAGRFAVVAWTTARNHPLTLEDLLDTIIVRVFGHTRHGLSALADKEALAARFLHEHKTLLVIDNMDTIKDDGVRGFALRVPEPSKVLITSRHADLALAADVHHLSGLSDQDGVDLLRALSADDDRLQSMTKLPDDRLRSLNALVGGLPLMLRWLIGQARTLPLDALQQSIEEVQGEAADVYEFIFLKSFSSLRESGRWVLASVSIYASPVTFEAIHRTTGRDYFDVVRAVRQAVDLSLLEATASVSPEERLYSLHPLTRYYVEGILRDAREMNRAIHVHASSWLLDEATRQALEGAGTHDDWRDYVKNVLAVARWCLEHSQLAIVLSFRNTLSRTLWVRGLWRQRLELGALALEAARYVGNPKTLASVLIDDLGWTTFALAGSAAEAKKFIEEGRTTCQGIGERYLEAKAVRHLAVIERDTGQHELADQHFHEALELARDIQPEHDRQEMVTNVLDMIGLMQLDQGKLEDAKNSFRAASEGFQKLKDDVRLSKVFNHMGRTFELQQTYEEAGRYFSRALTQATAAKRLDERAHALFGLARIATLTGNHVDGKRLLEDARASFEDLGDLRALEKLHTWESRLAG